MTCKESIKWLESLKKAIGQSQYQGLWHYEQALAETIELLQNDRVVELPYMNIEKGFDNKIQYVVYYKNKFGGISWFVANDKNIAEQKLKELNVER